MTRYKVKECVKFLNGVSKNSQLIASDDSQKVQFDVMQLVSSQAFLKKCDITGLTMIAWSVGEIAKKSDTKFSGSTHKIFENFMRILEQQYLFKMRNEILEN